MDWTAAEVNQIVVDYFDMLRKELANEKYSKTDHWKALLPLLQQRTKGAVEFKHRNISAVLVKMELPFIRGYYPSTHYQALLEEAVAAFIQHHHSDLLPAFSAFANNIGKEVASTSIIDFSKVLESAPPPSLPDKKPIRFKPIRVNYLEREQSNRALGEKGEAFVMAYEQWRLQQEGSPHLIADLQWVSKEKGDGAGYDILSKNSDGSDRYIEVKTTKLAKECPFYLTTTEVSFAAQFAEHFYLYRVFDFGDTPKLFIQHGSYQSYCQLEPVSFKGYF